MARLLQGVASQPAITGRLGELLATAIERVTARYDDFLLFAQREYQLTDGQDSLVRGRLKLMARHAELTRREHALSRKEEQISAAHSEQLSVQAEMEGREEILER